MTAIRRPFQRIENRTLVDDRGRQDDKGTLSESPVLQKKRHRAKFRDDIFSRFSRFLDADGMNERLSKSVLRGLVKNGIQDTNHGINY